MKRILPFLLFFAMTAAQAQLSVVSFSPANGTTNVPLHTTLSITFSAPLDSSASITEKRGMVTSVDSMSAPTYSPDLRTVNFQVTLSAGKAYFAGLYWAKALGGAILQNGAELHFTTASSFPSYHVNGSLSAGTTGHSLKNSLVAICATPLGQGGDNPTFVAGAITGTSGVFTIPYVANGTYYPVAALDATGDGEIDPSHGDALAVGDPITVTDADYTGLSMTFAFHAAPSYGVARDTAMAASAQLPAGQTLRLITCWDADSVAHGQWEFEFISDATHDGYSIRYDGFITNVGPMDMGNWSWMQRCQQITSVPSGATADSFAARVERSGGLAFRTQPGMDSLVFKRTFTFGQLGRADFSDMTSDTNQCYWGSTYSFGRFLSSDYWLQLYYRKFLADASGNITSVLAVKDQNGKGVPNTFSLGQNYPNPFNPTTTITYNIPVRSRVTLEVYNLLGERVALLVNGEQGSGFQKVAWQPKVASGVYFYRLRATPTDDAGQEFVQVRKMIYVR